MTGMDKKYEPSKHRRFPKTELGYTRNICGSCLVDWPCPDVAQAREAAALAEHSVLVVDGG